MLSKEFTNSLLQQLNEKKYVLFLFFYSCILLYFSSSFSPLYGFNSWPDVNVYYTIGKGLFFDKVPYKDLFDHKGPLIFFIYGLGYFLTPNSFTGMFFIEAIFFFVTLYYVYKLSNLFLNHLQSLLCACIFPSMLFTYTDQGGSAEEFFDIDDC